MHDPALFHLEHLADVPQAQLMEEALAAIRASLLTEQVVYVHCWGGVGRTGTVLGCLLVEDGLEPAEAIDHLETLRQDTQRAHRRSPEMPAQCDVHPRVGGAQRRRYRVSVSSRAAPTDVLTSDPGKDRAAIAPACGDYSCAR